MIWKNNEYLLWWQDFKIDQSKVSNFTIDTYVDNMAS